MLLLKVKYDSRYYRYIVRKIAKIRKNTPIHIDILTKRRTIFIASLDDGPSVAFLYFAYLKAKEKGLEPSLLYARYVDDSWIPVWVKESAQKWLSKGLNEGEIEKLKKLSVTEYILTRWCQQ
jgi:hypothetical protein